MTDATPQRRFDIALSFPGNIARLSNKSLSILPPRSAKTVCFTIITTMLNSLGWIWMSTFPICTAQSRSYW